jgi:hypothetical protein
MYETFFPTRNSNSKQAGAAQKRMWVESESKREGTSSKRRVNSFDRIEDQDYFINQIVKGEKEQVR